MCDTGHALVRRSPLHADGDAVAVPGAFNLAPCPQSTRHLLRIREPDLPRVAGVTLDFPINRFMVADNQTTTRLGPDEWLLHGLLDASDTLDRAVTAALRDIPHALVDIGHRHMALTLEGSKAADMLNAGCPLDLAAKAFPTGSATRTLLGKAEIILWRRSDTPTYVIECGRSFAPYVWEFLVEAGREYR